jgi:hypothetical protein
MNYLAPYAESKKGEKITLPGGPQYSKSITDKRRYLTASGKVAILGLK